MLDFDEEIQKFQPSLEVEDAEDAIYKNDVPDITDLINKIIEETGAKIDITDDGDVYISADTMDGVNGAKKMIEDIV